MWGKLYLCAQQGPTGKSLNPQRSSAGHWGGLIKGHLSPTMCCGAGWSWWGSPPRGTEFMALVNMGVQDRGTEEGYVPETLFTQDEESTASPSLTPPQPSPLITTIFRGAANTMPSHSPPFALNHCWDNEGNPAPHHLHHPSAPPRPPNRHFFYWNSLVF